MQFLLTKMKKYEAYKNSGVEWIGEIPEGWEILKEKYIFENLDYLREPISSENRERNNPIYDYYGASGVIDKIDHYNVEDKVLLIGEDGANLVMRNLPLIYKAKGKFWVNNHAHILKPLPNIDYEYMFYTLEAADYTTYITGAAQPKLSQENLARIQYPVPPYEEQQAIASYLDHKVGQIDASVSAINAQINDLKAYRQSIISEAVTKGLNPDVKMKDSGIEGGWSIPVHWSSNRLKFLADIVRGGSPRPIEEYIADEGYNWIKIGDTIKGYKYIESTKEKIKPSGLNATREVHVNDLILSNSMSFGQPYILKIDGCIHDGWLAFTNYKGLDKEYLYYVLQAGVCSCQFEHYVAGGVVQNLNIEKVATTRIPLPPLAEQQSIATYLDKKTAQIDSSIDSLEVQRDDLNVLKQSIISEAVTGKIDLRDWKLKK